MARKKHKKSILQQEKYCYLCDRLNRTISEAEGFKCWLCTAHHTYGPEAVHNNISNMRILQQEAQRAYEKDHTREEFVRLIGRNYLVT